MAEPDKLAVGNDRPIRPNGNHRPLLLRFDLFDIQNITALIAMMAGITILAMMMHSNSRDTSRRGPPAYDPENERNYSFRTYMTDISLWLLLTDMDPPRQCAAIINRLGGAAREMGRMMTPQEIAFGGVREGRQLVPVTCLLGALQSRFGAFS